MVLAPAGQVRAQTLRLGAIDMTLVASSDFAYDSNVDDLARDENPPRGYERGDFYWTPRISLMSQTIPMHPHTTLSMSASLAYEQYLKRDDLSTELYDARISYQRVHPRLTIGADASVVYDVESSPHEYIPGRAKRDPKRTDSAGGLVTWNYRKLRLEGNALFTRERHDFEEYQPGDEDEFTYGFNAYLDPFQRLSLNAGWQSTETTLILTDVTEVEDTLTAGANLKLFDWVSFYYTFQDERTRIKPSTADDQTIENTFGFTGTIPERYLRHPLVTWSIGYEHEENRPIIGPITKKWHWVYTLSASDHWQVTKNTLISGSASWDSDTEDDEVTFVYNVQMVQQVGPRAQQTLSFSQEPRSTFGSTTDTETTTYGYTFTLRDIVFYGLNFNCGVTYETDLPLNDPNAQKEKTTTYNAGLTHSRQFSRKLSRTLAYTYTWEKSNFDTLGPTEKHLIVYGLAYTF